MTLSQKVRKSGHKIIQLQRIGRVTVMGRARTDRQLDREKVLSDHLEDLIYFLLLEKTEVAAEPGLTCGLMTTLSKIEMRDFKANIYCLKLFEKNKQITFKVQMILSWKVGKSSHRLIQSNCILDLAE